MSDARRYALQKLLYTSHSPITHEESKEAASMLGALAAQVEQLTKDIERLRGTNSSAPTDYVLIKLADGVRHLLDDHSCDMLGHEGLRLAEVCARERALEFRSEQVLPRHERIQSLLCGAFEGGSNYWYQITRYVYADGVTAADFSAGGKFQKAEAYWHRSQLVPLQPGCSVVITVPGEECTSKEEHLLNAEALEQGMQVFASKYTRHYADWLSEEDDAETGDVFLQCCLFGELVYG